MRDNLKAFLLICLIFFIIISTSWNALKSKVSGNNIRNSEKSEKISIFSFTKPLLMNFTLSVNWNGVVKPVEKAKVIATTEGEIVSMYVSDGTIVKKGLPLFKLGGAVIKTKLDTLKQKIDILKKQRDISKKILNLKKLSFSRQLIKKDELLKAEENYNNLKSEISLLLTEISNIQNSLLIVSPINGYFFNRKISVGQTVTKNEVLAEVASTKKLRIEGKIFAENSKKFLNKKVYAGNIFVGRISKILPVMTINGETIFWVTNNNLKNFFKINEKVTGIVNVEIRHNVLAIPAQAVVYDERENPYVFIEKNGKFKKLRITVGIKQKGFVEVVSGVTENDRVVCKGAYELFYENFNKSFKVAD